MATLALPARPSALTREQVYRSRYLIAFAVTLASVLELVDTSIVNVAIPHMMGNLGATLEEVAWVSTGYIVANVIVLPQLAQGTGLFNLSRQLGGSLGIALTATLLTRFTEQSREALLPHVSPANPAAIAWLEQATTRLLSIAGSLGAARQQALALLEATLRQQASMVAFEKVFLTMGVTFAAALPLLLLFRTGRTRWGAGAH